MQRKANSLLPCPGAHQIGEFRDRAGEALTLLRPRLALGELRVPRVPHEAIAEVQVRPWGRLRSLHLVFRDIQYRAERSSTPRPFGREVGYDRQPCMRKLFSRAIS